jgi:hypothetical protein
VFSQVKTAAAKKLLFMAHQQFKRVFPTASQASSPAPSRQAQNLSAATTGLIHGAENLSQHNLPALLSRIESTHPDAARLIASTQIQGLATVGTDGRAIQTNASLMDLIKNPGQYRSVAPMLFQLSISKLAKSVAGIGAGDAIMALLANAINALKTVGEMAEIAPPLASMGAAYENMSAPSQAEISGAINALAADPSMAGSAANNSGIGGSLPAAWAPGVPMLMPSYVSTPNVYAPDPMMYSNLDNITNLGGAPSYQFDSTGYIKQP